MKGMGKLAKDYGPVIDRTFATATISSANLEADRCVSAQGVRLRRGPGLSAEGTLEQAFPAGERHDIKSGPRDVRSFGSR